MSNLIDLVGRKGKTKAENRPIFRKTVLRELQSSDTLDRATLETTGIRGEKEIERQTLVKHCLGYAQITCTSRQKSRYNAKSRWTGSSLC